MRKKYRIWIDYGEGQGNYQYRQSFTGAKALLGNRNGAIEARNGFHEWVQIAGETIEQEERRRERGYYQ